MKISSMAPMACVFGAFLVSQPALADAKASLIRVQKDDTWTVCKTSKADQGKVKIYDVQPDYKEAGVLNTLTGNANKILTTPIAELKEPGIFTFKKKGSYWIVFYPKDRKVGVSLDFVPNYKSAEAYKDQKVTLSVSGTFYTATDSWAAKPDVGISTKSKSIEGRIKVDKAQFEMGILGNRSLPILTLD